MRLEIQIDPIGYENTLAILGLAWANSSALGLQTIDSALAYAANRAISIEVL